MRDPPVIRAPDDAVFAHHLGACFKAEHVPVLHFAAPFAHRIKALIPARRDSGPQARLDIWVLALLADEFVEGRDPFRRLRRQLALAQLCVNLRGRVVKANLQHRNVRSAQRKKFAQLEFVHQRLGVGKPIKRACIMREHQVALMTDDLSQTDVPILASLEVIDEIGRMARVFIAPLLRQRVPGAPVECKHAMENPPTFERFRNVRVAHVLCRFVLEPYRPLAAG